MGKFDNKSSRNQIWSKKWIMCTNGWHFGWKVCHTSVDASAISWGWLELQNWALSLYRARQRKVLAGCWYKDSENSNGEINGLSSEWKVGNLWKFVWTSKNDQSESWSWTEKRFKHANNFRFVSLGCGLPEIGKFSIKIVNGKNIQISEKAFWRISQKDVL